MARWESFTDPADPTVRGWAVVQHEVPLILFLVGSAILAALCFVKRLSLIPVMGVLTCGYLMTELGWHNWVRFGIWLALGLVLYFAYGYRHSNLGGRAGRPGTVPPPEV